VAQARPNLSVLNESPTHLHDLELRANATINKTYETNLSEEEEASIG
jgi:hypothetical protein